MIRLATPALLCAALVVGAAAADVTGPHRALADAGDDPAGDEDAMADDGGAGEEDPADAGVDAGADDGGEDADTGEEDAAGPDEADAGGDEAGAPAAGATGPCTTLVDAVGESGLTTLASAVGSLLTSDEASQLAPLAASTIEIPDAQKITIFAPSNEAFPDPLPAGETLVQILLNHIVMEYYPSATVLEALDGQTLEDDGLEVMSLFGPLTVKTDGEEGVFVEVPGMEEPAQVTMADINTCVGVIHVIDAVLIPEGLDAMAPGAAPAGVNDTAVGPALADVPALAGVPSEAPLSDVDDALPPLGDDGLAPLGDDALSPDGGAGATDEAGTRSLNGTVEGQPSAAGASFVGAAVAVASVAIAALA